jgi:hypothetical protein
MLILDAIERQVKQSAESTINIKNLAIGTYVMNLPKNGEILCI